MKSIDNRDNSFPQDLYSITYFTFFINSGDTGFDAVTQWDDITIGNGNDNKPGPVFLKLAKLLFDDALSGNTPHHEKILYD